MRLMAYDSLKKDAVHCIPCFSTITKGDLERDSVVDVCLIFERLCVPLIAALTSKIIISLFLSTSLVTHLVLCYLVLPFYLHSF
jgi:hypothetical protein